jgi:hypothetical protein
VGLLVLEGTGRWRLVLARGEKTIGYFGSDECIWRAGVCGWSETGLFMRLGVGRGRRKERYAAARQVWLERGRKEGGAILRHRKVRWQETARWRGPRAGYK